MCSSRSAGAAGREHRSASANLLCVSMEYWSAGGGSEWSCPRRSVGWSRHRAALTATRDRAVKAANRRRSSAADSRTNSWVKSG